MKLINISKRIAILLITVLVSYSIASSQMLAFPEAEGHGALSVGGRGGRIIEVTNLFNSGSGSLREAVEASGPRIVIFRVAGYIDLTYPIKIYDPYLTIAGQTAPGDGICIRMKPGNSEGIQGLFYVPNSADDLHNVIIRYLKFRQGWTPTYKGHGKRPHNIYFRRGHDVILDHVSSQWTRDNLLSISLGSEAVASDSMYNFSIQNSLFGESEDGHSTGMNVQGTTPDNPCNYTGKWVKRVSIHKNLFAGSDHRNPRVNTNQIRVTNNVIYNWGNRAGSSTHDVKVDFINNYYKAGPQTTDVPGPPFHPYYQRVFHEPWSVTECTEDMPPAQIHMSGNIMTPHHNSPSDPYEFYEMYKTRKPLEDKYKRDTPLSPAIVPVTILSVNDAYNAVLADVGCNARLDENGVFVSNLVTDTVDSRMINNAINGTGFDHEVNKSDWDNGRVAFLTTDAGTLYADTDHDGMADVWETNHFGDLVTAKYDAANKTDYDKDGYSDFEEFLNASDPKVDVPVGNQEIELKESFALKNYPNPFNISTTIEYTLTQAGNVCLKVYDFSGREVATLVNNEYKSTGKYNYLWNTADTNGNRLTSGIYLIRITTELKSKALKISLLR